MRATYATAQRIGRRTHQCDAVAVRTAADGTRAYAVLDGIGSDDDVQQWTRNAAVRLAVAASKAKPADGKGAAEVALRAEYAHYAADEDRHDRYMRRYMPSAAAIVAVTAPGQPLTVAWSGDSRAYLKTPGAPLTRLTQDHNMRRVYPPTGGLPAGSRNVITAYLGCIDTDADLMAQCHHPAVEAVTVPLTGPCRLILATDGTYEPHEDDGRGLEPSLTGPLHAIARRLVETAVRLGGDHADNASVLVADVRP